MTESLHDDLAHARLVSDHPGFTVKTPPNSFNQRDILFSIVHAELPGDDPETHTECVVVVDPGIISKRLAIIETEHDDNLNEDHVVIGIEPDLGQIHPHLLGTVLEGSLELMKEDHLLPEEEAEPIHVMVEADPTQLDNVRSALSDLALRQTIREHYDFVAKAA